MYLYIYIDKSKYWHTRTPTPAVAPAGMSICIYVCTHLWIRSYTLWVFASMYTLRMYVFIQMHPQIPTHPFLIANSRSCRYVFCFSNVCIDIYWAYIHSADVFYTFKPTFWVQIVYTFKTRHSCIPISTVASTGTLNENCVPSQSLCMNIRYAVYKYML